MTPRKHLILKKKKTTHFNDKDTKSTAFAEQQPNLQVHSIYFAS